MSATSQGRARRSALQRVVIVGNLAVMTVYLVAAAGLAYGYSDVPMLDLAPDRLMARGEDVGAAILELMPAA